MLFAELATKRSSLKRSKFFWPQKNKTPLVGAAFTISEGRDASGHRLDTRCQTRHATCCGVLGHDALGRAALDLRLRIAQRRRRGLLVSALDRFLDLLDRAAHATAARGVRGGATLGLAGALLSRLVTGPLIPLHPKGAGITARRHPVNPPKNPPLSGV